VNYKTLFLVKSSVIGSYTDGANFIKLIAVNIINNGKALWQKAA